MCQEMTKTSRNLFLLSQRRALNVVWTYGHQHRNVAKHSWRSVRLGKEALPTFISIHSSTSHKKNLLIYVQCCIKERNILPLCHYVILMEVSFISLMLFVVHFEHDNMPVGDYTIGSSDLLVLWDMGSSAPWSYLFLVSVLLYKDCKTGLRCLSSS